MPRARRRRHSGRHRADDELFGPPPGRSLPSGDDITRPGDIGERPREAVAQFENVLAANPLDVDARIALARLHELMDRPDLAVGVLDDGLARQSTRAELLLARARAYGQQRRHQDAETDLRRVLRLYPSHGPAYFELGLILVRRGRAADAADAFARAVALGPESADTYTELAEALNQSGRLTDAAVALERAVALGGAQPRAYNLLGRVLDRLQRSDEATLMYRRARELAGR